VFLNDRQNYNSFSIQLQESWKCLLYFALFGIFNSVIFIYNFFQNTFPLLLSLNSKWMRKEQSDQSLLNFSFAETPFTTTRWNMSSLLTKYRWTIEPCVREIVWKVDRLEWSKLDFIASYSDEFTVNTSLAIAIRRKLRPHYQRLIKNYSQSQVLYARKLHSLAF